MKPIFAILPLPLISNVVPAYAQLDFRVANCDNIWNPLIPGYPVRYVYFGSTSHKYHLDHARYSGFESAVAASFESWNAAGAVQFSSSRSQGLALKGEHDPGLNPGWANVQWSIGSCELMPGSSEIILNTGFAWEDGEQNLYNRILDVQSIVTHEIGHIHGLMHPLESSYQQGPDAPTMAGGDNEYFWTSTAARTLEPADMARLR